LFGGLTEALRFLLPLGNRRATDHVPAAHAARSADLQPVPTFTRAVPWIVLIGLAVGLLWVGTFRLTWRLYGETANVRLIPALAVVLLECLLTGQLLVLGLARTTQLLGPDRPKHAHAGGLGALPPAGTLVLLLIILSQWVLILSIPDRAGWWPSDSDPRHYLNSLYPRPILRPLLVAPVWGRWGILLAASVGKTARQVDPQTRALGQAMTPGRLLRNTILPLLLTGVYFSREHNRLLGVIIGVLVFGVSYLFCVGLARRGGGQTRQSVFAAGQFAQLAFLAIYRAFWPLIHG
jgi:hypothetical protein